jgi:polar amino acid transport system substrate-binding protein
MAGEMKMLKSFMKYKHNTKEIRSMRTWLIIALILAMALTACSSPGKTSTVEGDLSVITEEYPPYNFTDKDGNITGQCTDIVRAIMNSTGKQIPIETMPLDEGIRLAEKGPGIVIYSLNRTPQREPLFQWVGPISNYEQAFYTKKGSAITIDSLEDAMEKGVISVYKGDAGAQFLASQGFKNLNESLTDIEALNKLMDGTAQLWLGNKKGLEITCEKAGVNPGDLELLPVVVIQADLYIAFSEDVPEGTVNAWQNALDTVKTERDIDYKTEYEKILAKYSDPEYIQSLQN